MSGDQDDKRSDVHVEDDAFPFDTPDHLPEILREEVVMRSGGLSGGDGKAFRAGFDMIATEFHSYDFESRKSDLKKHAIFERGDSVAVLPIISATRQVVLVDQFRVATYLRPPPDKNRRGWVVEAVAGMPKNVAGGKERYAETAVRETREETGLAITEDDLTEVGWFWSSPGGVSERIIVFLADISGAPDAEFGGKPRDRDRGIRVRRLAIEEFLKLAQGGEFVDPKIAYAALALSRRDAANREAAANPDVEAPATFTLKERS